MTDVPIITVDCEAIRELIYRMASSAKEDDKKQEETLCAKFDAVMKELQLLQEERKQRLQKHKAMSMHIHTLNKSKRILHEWDDTVWAVIVEKAIVHNDKSISFIFYNGSKVRVGT